MEFTFKIALGNALIDVVFALFRFTLTAHNQSILLLSNIDLFIAKTRYRHGNAILVVFFLLDIVWRVSALGVFRRAVFHHVQ
ncbi:Uncharacterised protein [Vibrio cholerae]|uniref:Uncharacterized protein n=1 Tax=Vibrio cholerae TaxID=666 RepID=A0A655RIT2_VIBCL|nr:Uncharacterised protein [Vibrio cholerae]